MKTVRTQATILNDIDRTRQRYEGAVDRGDIDSARHFRADLSALLEELGQADPDLEASMRRQFKFPDTTMHF